MEPVQSHQRTDKHADGQNQGDDLGHGQRCYLGQRPGPLSALHNQIQLAQALTQDDHERQRPDRTNDRDGKLTEEVILSIMQEERPNQREQFKMPKERISKYFAPGTPAQKIEDTIIKALELYRRRERQRDMER